MEMAFSRGLYTRWLGGVNNQELVHGRFGKKRGVFLGEVAEAGRDHVRLHLQGPLKPGDGVVFDAGKPEDEEEGGRVMKSGISSPVLKGRDWWSFVLAVMILIFPVSMSAINFGRPATGNWTGVCGKVSKAKSPNTNGLLGWKCMG